jgi:hypothetical protein
MHIIHEIASKLLADSMIGSNRTRLKRHSDVSASTRDSATKRYWCRDGFGPAAASYARSKSVGHVVGVRGWLKSRTEEWRTSARLLQ